VAFAMAMHRFEILLIILLFIVMVVAAIVQGDVRNTDFFTGLDISQGNDLKGRVIKRESNLGIRNTAE
jgi:hypothetical protein